jgi:6-phosphogluconolactonase
MDHQLDVHRDPEAVADAAADFMADRARRAVAEKGSFHFAVSGGRSPWDMFAVLASREVPWDRVVLYQVDERVAPADDPDRNLHHLRQALGSAPAEVHAMAVESPDVAQAAAAYARELPARFDLVHLGLGPDGHTASLVPGDPVLEVTDALVGVTGPYQGRRRMTLTYPALARADQLLWLVTGEEKAGPLKKLLGGDETIPAGRVEAGASVVMADRAAAGESS